jgi:hypothetical protein
MKSSSYDSHHEEGQKEEGQVVSEGEVVQEAAMDNIGTPPLQLTVDDIVGAFGEIDLTPMDDEPPDDMLNIPHDPTADISPAQHEAELTRRVKKVGNTVRPKPLAATAKLSKASSHNKDAWLFGHWQAKSSPIDDEQPPFDDAYADAMGEQMDNTDDDDVEVF